MKKTTIVNGLILTGLLGFIMVMPALASAPTGEYPYRIPVTITTSGGAVTEGQPLCLEYDPQLLINLGYATEVEGSLENVRLNNLLGDDVWLMNAVDGSSCNWFTGSAIADGSQQTYNLYSGHPLDDPADASTPVLFLPDAAASIEVADVSSMRVSSNLTLKLDEVTYSERPASDHTLLEYPGSYTVVSKSDGTIETTMPTITTANATHPQFSTPSSCYATGGFSGCAIPGSTASCSYCTINSTVDFSYNYNHWSTFSPISFANTCTDIVSVNWYSWGQLWSNSGSGYTVPYGLRWYVGTASAMGDVTWSTYFPYYWTTAYSITMLPSSYPWLTCNYFTGSTWSIRQAYARTTSDHTQQNFSYGLLEITYKYQTVGASTVLTSTVQIPVGGGTYDYSLTYGSGTVTQTIDDGTTVDVQTAARTAAVSTPTGDWTLAGTNDAAVTLAGARVGATSIATPTWKLDLEPYSDRLTELTAGPSWSYTLADDSASANDATWAFSSDHTGITLALGALAPVLGLPAVLITSSLSDTVGTLNDLTAVATGSTFNGRASIQAAIDQIGAQSGTIWFLMLAFLGLLLGAWAVRFTGFSFLGLLIASAWCAVGWPLGLYAPWIGIVGCLALLGTGAGMALVNRR